MSTSGKTNMISFWRVVFTVTIAIHHLCNTYSIPTYWMIGVEFFFIVSGWLLADKADKEEYSAFDYTIYRVKRLFPYYITAFIICAICMRFSINWNVSNQWSINNLRKWFIEYGFKEMIMIHYWPWGGEYWNIANIPTWYISVMLFCGMILFSLYKYNKTILCQVIIPISIMLFYCISYKLFHNFTEDEYIFDVISLKMLRGFTEMGIGILLHELHKKTIIKNIRFKSLIGFVTLAAVVILSYTYGEQYNYVYVLLISVGVFCSFDIEIGKGTKIISFLSSYTYLMYLNHNAIRLYLMPAFFSKINIWIMYIYLVLVFGYAFAMGMVTNGISRFFKRIELLK